ncbi:katanin-interacting protein-like isoform X2 [Physella acuta]|uniref:katanin-interacting protein-like isoform X2 n=1 Tax=Physella acuta TaxID=109671 RepID=UPI0027DE9C4F|nr:katanin-interacting protein-like isoform X2 [Physella acuta]
MDHSSRKKWTNGELSPQMHLNVTATKEVPPQYEHYLHLLQERNRLVKRLRQKDRQEIELEKKEKGFTLYLNTPFPGEPKVVLDKSKQRRKTADPSDYSSKKLETGERRRNWKFSSIEVTTSDGQKQKVKAPEILTGNYDEDFEPDDNEVTGSMSSQYSSMDASLDTPRKHKTSYLKRIAAAKREETEVENRVTIKMEDVKKLRESLQKNQQIRQSIAMDSDSDFDAGDSDRHQSESDGERISPIGEEIEEVLSSEEESKPERQKLFRPGDTLVLEFQPLPSRNKTVTNVTSVKKKTDSDVSIPFKSTKPSVVPSPSPIMHRSDSVKSSRPLSANRKSSDTSADPKEEADAVLRALREENKQVENFSKKPKSRPLPLPKNPPSGPTSVPLDEKIRIPSPVKSYVDPNLSKGNKSPIDDETEPINTVIQRVLKMNPKQQRELLNTLNHIDTEGDMIPTQQLKSITSSWSNKSPVTDRFEVTVEILSNWGHSSLVGLTELQFFDQSKCLIPVNPTDISIQGAKTSSKQLEALFNGKSKTTKERNMWSCPFDGRPIELSILLVNSKPSQSFQLGSIKVWNWNNKISNLDIGARHIRISLRGELLYDGEVDKGCGNQVFDYCKHIIISQTDKTVPSLLKKSASGHSLDIAAPRYGGNSPRLMSPPVEGDHSDPSGSHHTFRSISRSSQSSASSSGSGKLRGQSEERVEEGHIRSETRTIVRSNIFKQNPGGSGLSSPEIEASSKEIPERSQTPMKSRRVAAKLNGKQDSKSDSFDSKPPIQSAHKASVSSSKAMKSSDNLTTSISQPNTNVNQRDNPLVDNLKSMSQSESKRKKSFPKWLKGDNASEVNKSSLPKEEDDLQKQLDEEFERFSQTGKSSSSKSNEEDQDTLTPMKKIEKTRAKWRKEKDLEESWGSLSFFNKSHRGRVSIDMGDEELDEYLKPPERAESELPSVAAKISIPEDGWSDEDSEFTIPELPYGKEMVINIKTTWGDHHYVGLTGIQLFSSQGEQVTVAKIWADPSDINILPEYKRDPRVVTNIIDNVNRTRDDVHMWLAPYTPGNNHFVYITFTKPCQLALMRIWNYNKSRIHSFRGARDVVITLDGKEIFKGEIARACGGIEGGTEAFGDTILFTTDENILEAVSKNDDAFEGEMFSETEEEETIKRPSTADVGDDDTRPFTRAAGTLVEVRESRPSNFVTSVGDVLVYKTHKLKLEFTSTWGDHHYLGLTGLELVGSEGEAVPLTLDMMTATPRDLRHLPGNERDDRTLDKLLDGFNVTCTDSHMWLIPFSEGQSHNIKITFPQQTLLTGIRVWNYNKSPEDTYRGAKVMHVYINDKVISPPEGYLLRKGPGVCHFDFAQEISFSNSGNVNNHPGVLEGSGVRSGNDNYESVVQLPRGFIFQFQLFSSCGDQYYIGLNGLECYDAAFQKIELTQNNIAAYPDSVNVLDNVSNDARTPDKLIDGFNDTNDGRHMWLAPILPTIINRIYVIFDQPTSVSMIKLWNYSKTVSRGVKDFALLVDDLLVYNGTLQPVTGGAIGILPTCSASIPHHTILFSENRDIISKEKNAIISNQTEDQDIQLMNDKKIVTRGTNLLSSKPVNQALRPKTSVTKTAR